MFRAIIAVFQRTGLSSIWVTIGLLIVIGCGSQVVAIRGDGSKDTRQRRSSSHLNGSDADASSIINGDEWIMKSKASSVSSENQIAENNPADEPQSVAGSFLSDCEWLSI